MELLQLVPESPEAAADGAAETIENDVPGDPVQLQSAAARQGREALFDSGLQAPARDASQGGQQAIEPKLLPMLPDEIQNQAAGLVLMQAKSSAKLLEE